MDALDFEYNYYSQIFEVIFKEQKQVFLLVDFNINLLNYNDHQPTNTLHPTRITSDSKTS